MLARLRTYASFVRFSHSVFALPFALAGALLAARRTPIAWQTVGWIVVAMVGARSAAMGFNRLVDARIDALNPRTANRELPRGAMSRREAIAFVTIASGVFVVAASRLNLVCLALSPVALAIVFWYSLAKRYTTWTKLFLGLAMAVAPVGGWLAAGGGRGLEPCLLAASIARTLNSIARTTCARFRSASALARRSPSRESCTSWRSSVWWRWRGWLRSGPFI